MNGGWWKCGLAAMGMVVLAGVAGAETVDLKTAADWSKNPALKISEDGVLTLSGRRADISSTPFEIDPAKKYKISMEIRRTPGSPENICYIGNWSLDAGKKPMQPYYVMSVAKTDSTLAEAAIKGSKTVMIMKPAGWAEDFQKRNWGLVFNAKPDLSDLPNDSYNVVTAAEVDGDKVKLTLRSPLGQDYPAGTATRFHSSGSGMYAGWAGKPAPEEWTPISWVVTGASKSGNHAKIWWANAKYGAVRIIANYNPAVKDSALEVRNVKLEVLD